MKKIWIATGAILLATAAKVTAQTDTTYKKVGYYHYEVRHHLWKI
jgi:hypothetical protein